MAEIPEARTGSIRYALDLTSSEALWEKSEGLVGESSSKCLRCVSDGVARNDFYNIEVLAIPAADFVARKRPRRRLPRLEECFASRPRTRWRPKPRSRECVCRAGCYRSRLRQSLRSPQKRLPPRSPVKSRFYSVSGAAGGRIEVASLLEIGDQSGLLRLPPQ